MRPLVAAQRAAMRLNRAAEKWLPSALGIAVVLTFVCLAAALLFGFSDLSFGARVTASARAWGGGLSGLLSFAMQMCLVMLTGHMVATSTPFRRALAVLAAVPRTPRQTVAWTALVSMLLSLLNWGVSIIGSAVLVRAIASRRRDTDYRLLVAAAYLGLGCTWHAGLSASAPLVAAAPKNDFVAQGFLAAPVPAAETLGSPVNLGLTLMTVVLMTALVMLLHPPAGEAVVTEPRGSEEEGEVEPALGFDRSRLVAFGLAAALWGYLAVAFAHAGWAALDINAVNVAFIALALLLHGSLASFGRAATTGAKYLHGIIIQFPLYAGMGALIKESGLAARIAGFVVEHSSAATYPLFVYWYSGLVNYFIPSGGSKFAIEAPYLFPAAAELGVSPATVILACAWGDMMTDIIQPFWAIPLLAVVRLEFRDIAGYCAVLFLVYAAAVSAVFALAW